MSAPAAVSRPIPARVLDLLLERRFAPFHGVSRRREYAVQFGWINLPIAGLESACPQDRHGAERCQHRIQHLVRLMGRARALEARYTEPEKDLLLLLRQLQIQLPAQPPPKIKARDNREVA
jgi:hypothetical protein